MPDREYVWVARASSESKFDMILGIFNTFELAVAACQHDEDSLSSAILLKWNSISPEDFSAESSDKTINYIINGSEVVIPEKYKVQ